MNSERRQVLRDMLMSRPFISFKELSEAFPDVSGMTIRRDIDYFEALGEVIKVRGGARSMKFITTSMEDSFSLRLNDNTVAKEKIALKAMEQIETGRSVFIDSGTTMLKFASLMPDARVTVTTTGPNIALELVKKSQPIVNLIGGMLNRDNISVTGSQAMRYIEDINIDIAFIVPSGLSAKNGFTSGNYAECELKRMIVDKARKVIVLMDTSKLDKSLPYTFCRVDEVHTIITDNTLPRDISIAARNAGVRVIVAR